MNAQMIKTPGGEELVVLAKADYDALLARIEEAEEDAADVAAYDAAMARIAAADGDAPKVEFSRDRTISAFIRSRRKELGMTQIELAAAAGIGQGFISDLESGKRRASGETLDKLAAALAIDPAQLGLT